MLAVPESVLGVHQYIHGQRLADPLSQFAHGTFVNRNHYAALLEGILGPALGVAASCGLGVVFSFSRMGVIVVTTMTVAALIVAMRSQRLAALFVGGSVLSAVALAFTVGLRGLPERFRQLITERGDPFRLAVWLVAVLLHGAEYAHEHGAQLGRPGAGTARQDEQWVGLWLPVQGQAHDDLQVDRAALGALPVFQHGDTAAQSVDRSMVGLALFQYG